MGRQTATDVMAGGGSAVIIGRRPDRVDETVMALGEKGKVWRITADITDRDQVARVGEQLATEHADATLLVNADAVFSPLPFLDHDGADFDSYTNSNRGIFPLTQTVARHGREWPRRVDRQHRQHVGPVPAENYVRAVQAAC